MIADAIALLTGAHRCRPERPTAPLTMRSLDRGNLLTDDAEP